MYIYWVLFFASALMALIETPSFKKNAYYSVGWKVATVFLVLVIGYRHEVGGDWVSYVNHLEMARGKSFSLLLLENGEAAYNALRWLGIQSGGIYIVNFICALVFTWGLIVFCRLQPRPWLALNISIGFLVIVVAMGYARQSAALGMFLLGMAYLQRGRWAYYVAMLLLGSTFHISVLLLTPLALVVIARKKMIFTIILMFVGVLLSIVFLKDAANEYWVDYMTAGYQSSGANVRVAMNILPSLIFLWLRKHFEISLIQYNIWTWLAFGAISLSALLILYPNSAGVDRINLYLFPLQLFVYSHLPNVLNRLIGVTKLWATLVIGYGFSVQFAWLFYGDNASWWLPYQFYPWVLLWK